MRKCQLATTVSLMILALTGCDPNVTETGPDQDQEDELLAPPPSGQGVQFGMTAVIEPGSESEKCQFVKAPEGEDLLVQRDRVRFTEGSHHFLLYETAYDEIPTAKLNGAPVDTSGVFDCSDGPTNGWAVTKLVGGSQNANGDSILSFPDNVAMRVRKGAVLLMNAHYVNPTAGDLEAEVRANLYTIPESQLEHEGDVLFLYNLFIGVPAYGGSRATLRCPVHKDILLTSFQSHMHRLGVGYSAEVVGQAPFYENDEWEGVPVLDFGAGKPIAAGSVLDYHCDYKNPGSEDVYQGPRSTDEMCMAIGSYYPADYATSHCSIVGQDAFETAFRGGEWVGNGEATCAETLGCIQEAFGGESVFESLTECVLGSAPDRSEEVSDVVRCLLVKGDPNSECQAEFGACMAN